MRNIEIKARLENLTNAHMTAGALASPCGPLDLDQTDTYFNVSGGRFKLRECGHEAELIFYERPDAAGPVPSEYSRAPVIDGEGLKRALSKALGVKVVVRKKRTVFFYENVRIHLDEVEGLGSFIEMEAVLDDDSPDGEGTALLFELMERFSIREKELVPVSYCDLLAPPSMNL